MSMHSVSAVGRRARSGQLSAVAVPALPVPALPGAAVSAPAVRRVSAHRAPPAPVLADGREKLAAVAVLVSAAGLVAAVPALPSIARGVLLGAFVLVGPGCAVLVHVRLPAGVAVVTVPALGLAAVALASLASTELIGLRPLPVLVLLAVATLLGGWPANQSLRRLLRR